MKKKYASITILSAAISLSPAAKVLAQAEEEVGSTPMDEIVITGRKREESLRDIPVSIDVLSADLLAEAGVEDMYDFFSLIPGIDMEDPNGDRNGANPAIRGVQAGGAGANIITRRANSFLDGMPLTGQQGTINFIDAASVEVYSGPQSAAFGRSTFTGAINYVSRDPGEEFEGEVQLSTSSFGRNGIVVGLSGPINDTLGYTLDAQKTDYDGPDDWISTTEDITFGGTKTDYISGKLVWTPNDFFDLEVRGLYGETDDESSTRNPISAVGSNCTNISNLPPVGDAALGRAYIAGEVDCNFSDEFAIATNSTVEVPAQVILDHESGLLSDEEFALFQDLAASYSIPGGPVVENERYRFSTEMTFNFDNSLLQVLAFTAEEDSLVWTDADFNDATLTYQPAGEVTMGMTTTIVEASLTAPMGMAIPGGLNHMANPNTVKEEYLEVRWVSPGDQRLRWIVGGSYYNFVYDQENHNQYAAILDKELGARLTEADIFIDPTSIIHQENDNFGAFFNLTYDISDRTTVSFEGRYESDDVTNENSQAVEELAAVAAGELVSTFASVGSITGNSKTFQPRIAINHVINDDVSVYGQIAIGYNPGGANEAWLDPQTREAFFALQEEIASVLDDDPANDLLVAEDGEQAELDAFIAGVNYDETTLLTYEEEKMVNYEVGIKGSFLDNTLELTSALYLQEWTDMVGGANVNFDAGDFGGASADIDGADTSPSAQGNGGDARLMGLDTSISYVPNREWNIRGTLSLHDNEYTDFCNSGAIALGFTADVLAGENGELQDCVTMDGNELTRTPEISGSLSVTYRNSLLSTGWNYSVRGDVRHTGKTWIDTSNIAELPAYTTFNLNLAFTRDDWNITLFGTNLTNNTTPRSITFENTTDIDALDLTVTPQTPREFGLRARYNF